MLPTAGFTPEDESSWPLDEEHTDVEGGVVAYFNPTAGCSLLSVALVADETVEFVGLAQPAADGASGRTIDVRAFGNSGVALIIDLACADVATAGAVWEEQVGNSVVAGPGLIARATGDPSCARRSSSR